MLLAWCAQENYTEANFLCPVINQIANLYTDALEIELAKEWSNRCVEYAAEQKDAFFVLKFRLQARARIFRKIGDFNAAYKELELLEEKVS